MQRFERTALALSLLLAACGGGGSDPPPTTPVPSTPSPLIYEQSFAQPIALAPATSVGDVAPDNSQLAAVCPAGLPGPATRVIPYSAPPALRQQFQFTGEWALLDGYLYLGNGWRPWTGTGDPYPLSGPASPLYTNTGGGSFSFHTAPYPGPWGGTAYALTLVHTPLIDFHAQPLDITASVVLQSGAAGGFVGLALGRGEDQYREIGVYAQPDGTYTATYFADCSVITVAKGLRAGPHTFGIRPLVSHWQVLLDGAVVEDDYIEPPSDPRWQPGYVALVLDGQVSGQLTHLVVQKAGQP